jgi:PAS domain S-box-containing protein
MGAFTAGSFPATQSADSDARRLLIVEDDEDFADSLASILQPRGLALQVVRDPSELATVLERFSAEVALVDVRLGRFSGLDVVAELKSRMPEMLTVVMTAYVAAETAIEALRLGAYDYLTKPFEPSELWATLERCFDRIDAERARASAEAARRKSQARLRALVDNSLDLVAVVDPASRSLRFVAPSVTRLLGYPMEAAVADFTDYVHPEDRDQAGQVLQDCAHNEGAAQMVELRVRHRDGAWRWFEVAARALLSEPAIGGVLICARDVTERRAMEQKLRQVQRMEAIGQLTGGVAHDFNNLLAVIIGNLDLLKREVRDDPAQLQLVEGGMHAAERGATLIRRLLAFARRQTLTPRALDLNELINNAIELLRRAAGPHIQIDATLAPDLHPCIADTAQLETALLNLVINARDAMPEGGRVQIATSNVRLRGEQEVTGDEPGEPYVRVTVSDSGTGISEEIRGRVFEPFFSTKAPGRGTGLGLSMVLGFVEQSNGKIRLTTQVGAGTTFYLYFPRSNQQAVSEVRARTGEIAPRSRNETILLVEDDQEVQQMVRRLLGELGYKVTVASSGSEALALLETGLRPDLLLTDVVLPEGPNGFELAAQARARQPRLKLLFTSGYSQGVGSRRPPAVAGTFMLQKPFHRSELAHLIRRALDAPAA